MLDYREFCEMVRRKKKQENNHNWTRILMSYLLLSFWLGGVAKEVKNSIHVRPFRTCFSTTLITAVNILKDPRPGHPQFDFNLAEVKLFLKRGLPWLTCTCRLASNRGLLYILWNCVSFEHSLHGQVTIALSKLSKLLYYEHDEKYWALILTWRLTRPSPVWSQPWNILSSWPGSTSWVTRGHPICKCRHPASQQSEIFQHLLTWKKSSISRYPSPSESSLLKATSTLSLGSSMSGLKSSTSFVFIKMSLTCELMEQSSSGGADSVTTERQR